MGEMPIAMETAIMSRPSERISGINTKPDAAATATASDTQRRHHALRVGRERGPLYARHVYSRLRDGSASCGLQWSVGASTGSRVIQRSPQHWRRRVRVGADLDRETLPCRL
jgi:hypothetical protein